MKRKNILIVVGIFLLTLFITLYTISSSIYYRTAISAWMAIPDQEFIKSNNIKQIAIHFNDDDKQHFTQLFKDYQTEDVGVDNSKFLDHYENSNDWRETNLTINGKEYHVKVKSHGRTPVGHKYGEHFSLSVKFSDKPYPFYSKRINLIIYNRIQLNSEILKLMSSKFNLISPEFELVTATIGDHNDYLYFVEERINESFFLHRGLPMIIFNKNIDGSLIYNHLVTTNELTNKVEKELRNSDNLSPEIKSQIKSDYSNFNNAIHEKNIHVLKKHLNMDYIARLNAFRIIYGSDGHGFNHINLEMAYDTIARQFYPIVHRDVHTTSLKDCQNAYDFMDNHNEINALWNVLNEDTTFQFTTQQQIESFLLENNSSSITEELNRIREYYKQSFTYEFSYLNNNTDGTSIIENIKCLEMN